MSGGEMRLNPDGERLSPEAVLHMALGSRVVIELLPLEAPNTVASFIYIASRGLMDSHAIERIVPGSWVDVSYSGFGKPEARYLIPYESKLHPELRPRESHPGCVCMGGYGEAGLAGGEFFFPLRDCPEHRGIYPVFGLVKEGMDEILRIAAVPTVPVTDFPYPGVEVNRPVDPQVISSVEILLHGWDIPDPVRMEGQELPLTWR